MFKRFSVFFVLLFGLLFSTATFAQILTSGGSVTSANIATNLPGNVVTNNYAGAVTISGQFAASNVSANFMGKYFSIASPTTNEIIYWDGSKFGTKEALVFQSVCGSVYYVASRAATVTTYNQLAPTPDVSVATTGIITADSTATGNAFVCITPTGGLQLLTIPAGIWEFDTTLLVDSSAGTTKLVYQVYKRDASGVETLLFEEVDATEVNSTSYVEIVHDVAANAVVLNLTDRIVVRYRLITSGATRTVTFKIGGSSGAHVHTPAGNNHANLAGILGTGSYHMSAAEATQVTALDDMSAQASNNVTITGGDIAATVLSGTIADARLETTINVTGVVATNVVATNLVASSAIVNGTISANEIVVTTINAQAITGNWALNGYYLSGDGGDEGVFVSSGGNVGIGTTSPKSTLQLGTVSGLLDFNNGFDVLGNLYYSGGFKYTTSAYGTAIQLENTAGNINFLTVPSGTADADATTSTRMTILNGGNVGIGTANPARRLSVNGDAGGTSAWNNDSDVRLKKNIETITNALDKVNALRGVRFDWIDTENHPAGKQIGFIAQEANSVIPEVVSKPGEYYSMQYGPISALLVEAMKELKAENDAMKADNDALKARLSDGGL